MTAREPIDIVIPVYNEGNGIVSLLRALDSQVRTPFRLLICYDHDDDTTLSAIDQSGPYRFPIIRVKNEGTGPASAVLTGFRLGTAPAAIVVPSDDDYNMRLIDVLVDRFDDGSAIVCPSRFMKGGVMLGCPPVKATLVRFAAFTLYHLGRIPTHDPTNGFRLFSRSVLEEIPVESLRGFAFSFELLVKAHRAGWKITEVPAAWYERRQGKSRFRLFQWLPDYLRWYGYAFGTAFLRRGRRTRREKTVSDGK